MNLPQSLVILGGMAGSAIIGYQRAKSIAIRGMSRIMHVSVMSTTHLANAAVAVMVEKYGANPDDAIKALMAEANKNGERFEAVTRKKESANVNKA